MSSYKGLRTPCVYKRAGVPLRIYHPNGIRVRLGPQYPLSVVQGDLKGGGGGP